MSPHLLFHILVAVTQLPVVPQGHFVWMKKLPGVTNSDPVEAFARLNILMSGKVVHSPRRYVSPISIICRDSLCATNLYQQWNEVINVLSEYNSRDELLAKYLTIYHVFENLMLKLPIVELERQQAGRVFTMRDFKRLYKQVDMNELDALKRLFDKALRLEFTPGLTFEHHIVARWQGLTASTSDLENAIRILGLKKNNSPLAFNDFNAGGECTRYFTQMVYQTRCAIVHNKETELHLTCANLDAGFTTLIEQFLIPSLEELCFFLISAPNPHVWYSQKELLLYQ